MTESFAQMDIFFFATTVVVVVVGVLLSVLLVQAIRFLRDARVIAEAIKDEAIEVVDDVQEFRRGLEDKASKLSNLLGVVTTAKFLRRLLSPRDDD